MNNGILITTTILILIACLMDIKSRRVSNYFVLLSAFLGLAIYIFSYGISEVAQAFYAAGITAGVLLPFYLLRILGGGDYKFFIAISFLLGPWTTQEILVWSLLWGAVLGVAYISLNGSFRSFLFSLSLKLKGISFANDQRFKIPYTVAFLLGWITWYQHGGLL